MSDTSKRIRRSGRSVVDFKSEEDITRALDSIDDATNRSNDGSHDGISDWRIAPCDAQNDAYFTQCVSKEAKRLAVLKEYQILESGIEQPFEKVAEKVATRFGVSWAMISIVDMGRLWFKSLHNKDLGVSETPRESAFCSHVILSKSNEVFLVANAEHDERFVNYSLVKNSPGVRFYAGVPLTVPEGVRLGTLCLMDNKARPNGLSAAEQTELKAVAARVVQVLVKRKEALQKFKHQSCRSQPDTIIPPAVALANNKRSTGVTRSTSVKQKTRLDAGDTTSSEADSKKSKKSSTAAGAYDLIPRPLHSQLLPDPRTEGVDPDTYLAQLVEAVYGAKLVLKTALELGDFFPELTEDQTNAYSMDVVSVARANDTERLKEIFEERGREALDCFNRFGEGLLNLCCRRGFTESVKFLLSDEVRLSVRIRDDFGRTPLHDACWNPEPQIEICLAVVAQDPTLFFITDKRGYTPFQYARNTDWLLWRQFLLENRHLLAPLASPEVRQHFT